MKIPFSSVLLAMVLVIATVPLKASPLDDRVAELKHALDKEAAARMAQGANGANGFVNPGMNPAFLDASIDQMVAQMENPANGGNMDAQLAQITSVYTSDEVQEATTNLLNEIHKERKDKADAEIADLKALIARASQLVNQAKKPEELDNLISEMGQHENSRYGGNPELQGNQQLGQQFATAFEFVKQWQNYLSHLATGQTDLVRNDLQNLSQNYAGAGLIPRSKLLALAAPDKLTPPGGAANSTATTPESAANAQAQAILDGMKTLDDIPATLAKLQTLRERNVPEIERSCQILTQMLQARESLKAGLPAQVNFNYLIGNGPEIPAAIRAQLYLFALQARFVSFKGSPPSPTEKPFDFVDRVIADATTREDWELLHSAEEARQTLQQNSGLGYSGFPSGGIDAVIAGAHQEAAGQFALAVQSYQAALKSTDPAVPAKVIGDKLAAIQREHPKEFADGMQLTVAPPAPRLYQAPDRGLPFPARQSPMGMTGAANAPAPIPATLLSPAASNNAPAAPPK